MPDIEKRMGELEDLVALALNKASDANERLTQTEDAILALDSKKNTPLEKLQLKIRGRRIADQFHKHEPLSQTLKSAKREIKGP